jgi:phosphomannomutase
MPFVRSISGLRATKEDGLEASILTKYARAFAEISPKGKIILGRDGRPSGEWIEKVISDSLIKMGRQVEIIGIVPTPTVQLLTEHSEAGGGIAITASHNPREWNGLKFLGSDGTFLGQSENEKLWDLVDQDEKISHPKGIRNYKLIKNENALEYHLGKVLDLNLFSDNNYIENNKKRKLKAVVDAVNASGSVVVPDLLRKLGYEVIELFCDGSGVFPHTPEPIPENLNKLCDSVKKNGADIGIAVDPDADRLVIIDEQGKPIGEEKTIVLSAWSALEHSEELDFDPKNSKITVNLSTSRMIDDLAKKYNSRVERSAVGEINVVEKMKENNSIIGGEGSGGVILPACHYGRDSLVGIALVCALISKTGKSISTLASELSNYSMIKTKREFSGDLDPIIEKAKIKFSDSKINTDDGLRIDFENSWVQIRKSNTEPIIRIISEAKTAAKAKELILQIEILL